MKFTYKYKNFNFDKCEPVLAVEQLYNRIDSLFFHRDGFDICWAACESFKIGNYVRTARISGLNWSCAVLLGRYAFDSSCRNIAPEAVLDFNPNKVPEEWYSNILCLLRDGALSCEISRYDVAFDFPMDRGEVTLIPNDRQSYKQFKESSKGTTEYQGERSHHAAMKLYDKTKESGLDVPVTRCEITVDGSFCGSLKKLFPTLTTYRNLQLDTAFADLPFEVKACLAHPDLIPMLQSSVSRNTWSKLKALLTTYGTAELSPGSWRDIDTFVRSALAALKGCAA